MFYIGQKVVCIDDKIKTIGVGELKEDTIYTVEGFNDYDEGLILREIKSPSHLGAYLNERFIPLSAYSKNAEALEQLFKELDLRVN
jgi:hypothetical protein